MEEERQRRIAEGGIIWPVWSWITSGSQPGDATSGRAFSVVSDKIKATDFNRDLTTVGHFAVFENLVFAMISKMLRILTEHIEKVCSLESKLFLISLCSIRILNIQEVITKTTFSKIAKCTTLA